jgi:hypothetical protein
MPVNHPKPNHSDLATGPRYRFRDWPNREVPQVAAGVYAVWRDDGELVYVGMSGRSIESFKGKGRYGLWTRLNAHTAGRLSGDQFCVYIANRYVIPTLTPQQLPLFATGELRLDVLTRDYIREHLSYSFALVDSSAEAHRLERDARRGMGLPTKPTLNPL